MRGQISPVGNFKLYLSAKHIDFRKGMDGLGAIVMNEFELDPFSGAIFIFRSKHVDRMKIIVWDGMRLIMTYKRIDGSGFVWPRISDGVITTTVLSLKPHSKAWFGKGSFRAM